MIGSDYTAWTSLHALQINGLGAQTQRWFRRPKTGIGPTELVPCSKGA